MPEIGWQVLDPDGNVVASGPITQAQMSGDLLSMLGESEEGAQ